MTRKFQDGVTLARGGEGTRPRTRAHAPKWYQVHRGEVIKRWITTFQSGLTVTKFVPIRVSIRGY
jgi:hypothetical protein